METLHRRLAILAFVVVMVTVLVLSALAGEAYIRHHERTRVTVPGTMPLLVYPHTRLRHALVRDYDYFGWASVNRQGFRGAPVELEKRPGSTRIMVVGGSTTFDTQVGADDKAWPARLEHWFNQLAPEQEFDVINAGVGGYVVFDNLIRLQMELHQYRPDAIILYHSHNDLNVALGRGHSDPGFSPRPGEARRLTPWTHWLSRNSLLYSKVRARWRALRFQARGRGAGNSAEADEIDWDSVIERGVAEFEHEVASFLALADRFEIPVILVEVVFTGSGHEPDHLTDEMRRQWAGTAHAPAAAFMEGYRRFGEALRKMSESTDAQFIPTSGFGLGSPEWYAPGDAIHFNPAGADRMGRLVAEALLEHELP